MSTLDSDLRTLAREAYVYLYPLVTMEVTRRVGFVASKPGMGPPNDFHHIRAFPDADFRVVVRPNFDTLYSSAWVDLRTGPARISAPDTDDRYYMLPMLDMWTDVFANPGKRTTGTGAQDFILVGPGYDGEVPTDGTVIHAPTPWVWIIGRTQTNGPADYDAVHAVQDGYRITVAPGTATPDADTETDPDTEPLGFVNGMSGADFFAYADGPLAVNPPHATDVDVLARISALGIGPGHTFDAGRFSADELAEIEAGVADAKQAIPASLPTSGHLANGWVSLLDGIGVYGNGYLKRALVTEVGLGANPPVDAVYPVLLADADGKPMSGDEEYVVHFDADQLPPVSAFWSITMYDAAGFQAANELNRFAIGDRDALTYNADGSLDIYLQHANPGPERVSNWLPMPTGPVGVTMRLYAPHEQVLTAGWSPPAVRRTS